MAAPIALDRLSKRYGRLRAVSDLTFDVREGEVFGFLGLNGAGKTTTIRCLLDLLRPTSGRASVYGFDCRSQGVEARALIGYLPGELGLFGDMTGLQVLRLLGALQGRAIDTARRDALLERFRLSRADVTRRIREYSTGMKRKLGIVQAFQHDPPLLVLDEPTEGLDPLMQDEFFGLVEEVTARGHTVFLSSHVLSEVERSCHRVALLREGELALLAPVDELRDLAPRRVRVTFCSDVLAPPVLPPALQVRSASARSWEIDAKGPIAALVEAVARLPVADLEVRTPRLEDILAAYYRRSA